MLALVSAVISGAAGAYVLKLMADAAIGTDLTVQPGQTVVVSGDQGLAAAPAWGAGGFSVQQSGSLSLEYVRLDAVSFMFGSASSSVGFPSRPAVCPPFKPFRPIVIRRPLTSPSYDVLCAPPQGIMVQTGGCISMRDCSLGGDITVAHGTVQLHQVMMIEPRWVEQTLNFSSTDFGSLQCSQPYTTLSDSWRATSNANRHGPTGNRMGDLNTFVGTGCPNGLAAGDQSTGVGGDRWYRFVGAGGDALPLEPPDEAHCGNDYTGWLSGWDAHSGVAGATPPTTYSVAGRYPTVVEGVVDMTACFDFGSVENGEAGFRCNDPVTVGVVHCEGFFLWRLLYAPDCARVYCTTASGL